MDETFARLKDPWMLRGWSDGTRSLVNRLDGDRRDLSTSWFHVAVSCDGRTNFDSAAFTPRHRRLLDRLVELGLAEIVRRHEIPLAWQSFQEAPTPPLLGLHWSITGRCNLACRHCYIEAPSGRYGELPPADMLRLVEQFRRANLPKVVLTGGEPLMRPDLPLIVTALAEACVAIDMINTNGWLVTHDVLRLLRQAGFAPRFQVSFDGVGFHDTMRGVPGSEERAIGAIRLLCGNGFRVIVSTSVAGRAFGCLTDTYDLLAGLGIDGWKIAVPQKTGNWRKIGDLTTLEDEAAAFEPLLRRWLSAGRPFDLQLGGFFSGSSRPESPPPPAFAWDDHDCATCREMPALLPDGTLLPCPMFIDTPLQDRMPNLLRDDLADVWRDSILRRWVDRRRRDLFEANPGCQACAHLADCGLGCRARALWETGREDARDLRVCRIWMEGFGDRFRRLAAG